jgi:sulfite dehydrogenase (quinone) subunit SoeA
MSDPALPVNEPPGERTERTTCYMCACRCGIQVHIKAGKIRYIEGNPEHPVNRGVLCAKGSAGIMQHYSPARLKKPLKRIGERGENRFAEIEWDEALSLAAGKLSAARAIDPNRLAFFTGRDQSQALTGWWAQQYGTYNYAAHGGFCSVNMAAAGLYTLGGSFWEFGEPDWEHASLLMLWGVAEDHDSNPIKLGLGKMKSRGAKVIAINPVRTGYGAIADEWVGIRPGTDGLLAMALIHELLRTDRVDLDYLVRFTNAHYLVIDAPGTAGHGLFARDAEGNALCWDRNTQTVMPANGTGLSPMIAGEYALADFRTVKPVFGHILQRYLCEDYSPEMVSETCGVPAETIRRLADELAKAAFDHHLELPIAWTDSSGNPHPSMKARPVAMHAMRGISAHANGFQTCRAIHLLQLLLGAVDAPGSFRYQPPFPRPIPPLNRPGKTRDAQGRLNAMPLGFIHGPEDLLVNGSGQPLRVDEAYSWKYPLAVHGMMHTVLRNAHAGKHGKIDVLMLFMANMSWNSAMNTQETLHWLTDKNAQGEYRIPYIIYADAYSSEMCAYADLILPDTTYLERFDAISLLDRPISDADGAGDAIRHPVLQPDRDVRGFQSVLLDLGARLQLPGMVQDDGSPQYRDYEDYILNHERAPGVGLLAGWRGKDGLQEGKGAVNPEQLQRYIEHGGYWHSAVPESARYFKMANRDYLDWAKAKGFIGSNDAIVLELYSETLQKFRLAAEGFGAVQPPDEERERIKTYFNPLPFWYAPFEHAQTDSAEFPLHALTQRPPYMYHAWGSQNAWLRQIMARNFLYLHPDTALKYALADGDWVELRSHLSAMSVPVKLTNNVQPDTVWTWNALGKRKGTWGLSSKAPESNQGFLLNPLISDLTPNADYANADPITGQAAWFDLRVSIRKIAVQACSTPQFSPLDSGALA